MGQAALKYDEVDQFDKIPIPEGGIATFLTAKTGSWADDDDDVPPKGITNVVKIADKLAKYGRNEDEYMVHAAEGETVVPMEVFNQNPALKDKLFAEMRIMGIEPERYVVGNELNSINPVTGQPEFFLKKLFKGLKKIVKKILPVVATIGLTMLGVPPPIASAIVSGAQVAIQGGSLKDSLKAAAIGGISSFAAGKIGDKYNWAANGAKQMATQAAINTTLSGGKPKDILASAALAGVTTKGMDFLGGKLAPAGAEATATVDPAYAKELAATNPAELARLQGIEGVTVLETPDFAPSGFQALGSMPAKVAPVDATAPAGGVGTQVSGAVGAIGPVASQPAQVYDPFTGQMIADARQPVQGVGTRAGTGAGTGADASVDTTAAGGQKVDFEAKLADFQGEQIRPVGEAFKEVFTGGGRGFQGRLEAFGDLFLPNYNKGELNDLLRDLKKQDPAGFASEFGDVSISNAASQFLKSNPVSFQRKFGPAGVALLAGSALFPGEDVELTDLSTLPSGFDLVDANPERYRVFYGDDPIRMAPSFGITRAAGAYQPTPQQSFFEPTDIDTSLPPLGAADGGEIMNFPRMNGPIEGPGTETSDDIPAMLSDGEFVFTAKAVRGAGRGSREDGMRNMYNMMRQFEAKV